MDNKITECELQYIKCFTEHYEDEKIIRFRDKYLKEMCTHNYTYIKKQCTKKELQLIIEDEISLKSIEGSNFCNITFSPEIPPKTIPKLGYKEERMTFGYYSFQMDKLSDLKEVQGANIKKIENKEELSILLSSDLEHDEKALGKEYCTRRCHRRGKVYLREEGVKAYICYHNGEIVGNCELFIHNGVGKIEDFAVLPKHQRKGYGTTILKHIIEKALEGNCHTCYLITGEDETSKYMYEKLGFIKVGERTELFFDVEESY